MAIPDGERCCVRVAGYSGHHFSQCSRRGVVTHEGRLYCWQHDPKAVKTRGLTRGERWSAEQQVIMREHAALSACEGIATDSLKPGLVRELVAAVGALVYTIDSSSKRLVQTVSVSALGTGRDLIRDIKVEE